MGDPGRGPIGVILAGGRGRRLGGDKARAELGGRPLIAYPLAALVEALGEVAVVAKASTRLPEGPDMAVWREPAAPRHPLVGIVHALRTAAPRSVLVCAADLPFVTAEMLAELAWADAGGASAVIAAHQGRLQPQLGRYEPAALAVLDAAPPDAPLRSVVAGLRPRLVEVPQEQLFNVNTPADLAEAEARLRPGGRG